MYICIFYETTDHNIVSYFYKNIFWTIFHISYFYFSSNITNSQLNNDVDDNDVGDKFRTNWWCNIDAIIAYNDVRYELYGC